MIKRIAVLLALATSSLSGAAAADDRRVAVFPFELLDTSLEGEIMGPKEVETARVGTLTAQLREAFAETPGFTVAEMAPVEETARRRHLQNCGGCDVSLAAEVGADWAVTGVVQKVSNLILNINVYVRDVETGELVQAMSADIRSNTDESWRRGLDWLIRNRLDLGA